MHQLNINETEPTTMARISEQVYEKIKPVVMNAEEGSFFSVRKCAGDLGVSYTPTREALIRLHNEGLLDLVPNVGFFVSRMDFKTINSIYQSRECVESYVLPRVIEKLDDGDLAFLEENIERQREALGTGDIEAYTDADVEFHCRLIDKLGNRQLSEFYRTVRSQFRVGSKQITQSHSSLPIEEHREFLRAIREQRYEEALTIYTDHSAAALERMREGYVRIG